MTRDQALDCLAREGVFMVSAEHGEDVARAFGMTLAQIGVEPTPADHLALAPIGQFNGASVRIKQDRRGVPALGIPGAKAVLMYQLAATLALHFGLFGNIDHAMQTPYHKPQSEARYISGRGAVRLAAYFGGDEAVAALRERNPFMLPALFREQRYTGTGARADRVRAY